MATAFGTLFYAFSVLVADSAAGAEFSTSVLSVAYGGTVLVGGSLAFVVGRLVDGRGARAIMGVGALVGAGGLVALAQATEPWHIVAASWGLIGPAGAMTFYEPAFVALNQWYGPTERGRAIGILTVIGGLAGPIFLPLTGALVDGVGWRNAAMILGAILAGIGITTATLALPSKNNLAGPHEPARRIPLAELLKDRRFAWYTVSVLLTYAAFQTVLFHRIALWEQTGLALGLVSFWAGVSGWLSFPGRYLGPVLAGGPRGVRWNAAVSALLAVTVIPAITTGGTVMMVLHFFGFGLVFGAVLPMRAAVMGRWFSGPRFGQIMGTQWTMAAFAGASGPLLAGVSRDAFGGYGVAMTATFAALIGAAGCILIAARQSNA